MDTVTITIFVLNGNVVCTKAIFLYFPTFSLVVLFVFSYIFNLIHWFIFLGLWISCIWQLRWLFSCFLLLLPFPCNGILIYTVWHLVYYLEHIWMFHKNNHGAWKALQIWPMACSLLAFFFLFVLALLWIMKAQPRTISCFINFISSIALIWVGALFHFSYGCFKCFPAGLIVRTWPPLQG